jgi:hypothetical protein
MTGFIGLFDTARDYTLQYTVNTHTSVHSHVFTSRCSVAASNDWNSLFVGSRTVPGLIYELLTSTAHSDLSPSNPLTNSTNLSCL